MDDMHARGICDAVERIAKSVESLVSIMEDREADEYEPETEPSKNCLLCFHVDEANELCKLYNARPPWRIVIAGCEEWKDKSASEYTPPFSKPAPTRPNADGLVSGVPMPDDDSIPF